MHLPLTRSLLLTATLLAGCATPNTARAAEPAADATSAPAPAFKGEPIVSFRAGAMDVGGLSRIPVYYLVDRRTQTCWFFAGTTNPLSCCALRRMPEAKRVITWESDESCAAPATPAPDAQPPGVTP